MKELIPSLLPWLVCVPLGAAFATAILAHVKRLSRSTGTLAVLAIAVNLILSVLVCSGAAGRVSIWGGNWGDQRLPIGIEIVLDGLSGMMLVVINFVALATVIFSASYMRRFTSVWLFHSLFLLMTGAMNGVVLAGDLFNLYVFIEVAAIASYGLVAFGTEREELEAAFKYMVLGVLASTFILIGVTLLYALTGQLNMARVAAGLQVVRAQAAGGYSPALLLAAACLLGGLSLKAAMVPFHAWLPDAHPSAPAPISAMLSGVLIKAAGVYALARIVFNVLGVSSYYANLLMAMGIVSMVVGVLLAVGQWDFKRLLAYHSISQMGYVVLALGAAAGVMARGGSRAVASLCLLGGLFHLFNHAAFKSLLFLSSGSIEQATGTRQLKEMGGLGRRMPVTSWCCRIGALSIAGVPPFNGFFSKLIIIIALTLAGYYVLATGAVVVALATLVSFVKVQRYALEGATSERTASARERPWPVGVGMGMLAVVCLVAGLAIVPLKDHLFLPAGEALLRGVAAAAGAAQIAMGGSP